MGMSYDEYWNQDPWLAEDYRRAYELKRDEENANMWLQGSYIYHAVGAVLGQAFGDRRAKYLSEPYDLHPRQKTAEEIQEEYFQRLTAWGEQFNERHQN